MIGNSIILKSAEASIRNVQNSDHLFGKDGKVDPDVGAVLAKHGAECSICRSKPCRCPPS